MAMKATAIREAQIGFEIGVLTYSRLLRQTFLHMAMAVVQLESQLYLGQSYAKIANNEQINSKIQVSSSLPLMGAVSGAPQMERESLEWN